MVLGQMRLPFLADFFFFFFFKKYGDEYLWTPRFPLFNTFSEPAPILKNQAEKAGFPRTYRIFIIYQVDRRGERSGVPPLRGFADKFGGPRANEE